ncbi:MAG: hypothetical protein ACI9UV_002518 [Algoriphagus sp.]|jgi:hypothetical protein
MKRVLADLHYFPSLEFFTAILDSEELLFLPIDRYQRQSFFNRCQIRLANKVETLSVPIVGRRPKISQSAIRIDYEQNWEKIHLRGIQSAYGKAPFYEFYFPYFEAVYQKKHEFLWDLNWDLLTICLKLLGLPVKIGTLNDVSFSTEIQDIRRLISPSVHFSERDIYTPQTYFQLFGSDFESNLSVMDLLFCEGPASKSVLLKSAKKD